MHNFPFVCNPCLGEKAAVYSFDLNFVHEFLLCLCNCRNCLGGHTGCTVVISPCSVGILEPCQPKQEAEAAVQRGCDPGEGSQLCCPSPDCDCSFKGRCKLREHLRSHTQEKVVACPTCGGMFANNTKFFDHIRRQTALDRKPRGREGWGRPGLGYLGCWSCLYPVSQGQSVLGTAWLLC